MGIPERKEREREARRGAILSAAEAVFRAKGFQNATVEDIARQAELAKGTVYLYYKSKEELQVGLVLLGFELMAEEFRTHILEEESAVEKLAHLGEAYWDFAQNYPFYFDLMNAVDVAAKVASISPEMVADLHGKSSGIWEGMTAIFDQGKAEGTIQPEVNSLYAAMLLWLNAKSVLYFHLKIRNTPDSVWKNDRLENPCNADFYKVYDLDGKLFLHQIATEEGKKLLGPIEWPAETSKMNLVNCRYSTEASIDAVPEYSDFQL